MPNILVRFTNLFHEYRHLFLYNLVFFATDQK